MEKSRFCRVAVLCALFICLVSPALAKSSGRYVLTVAGEQGQVKYAAPLFSCEGETVVVILPEIVARLKEGATQNDLEAVC